MTMFTGSGRPAAVPLVEPEHLRFDLPHISLSALAWGPEDGRVFLCLHGFPDSAATWRHLGPLLAERGHRVVAPFMRGYAPSPLAHEHGYQVGALMADAVALHAALGSPPDTVLIGHDWGGWANNGIAALEDSPFSHHVSVAIMPIPAIDPREHGLARRLVMNLRQLRMSWYILFFQVPALPERVLPRVIKRLWRDWSPRGTDVGNDVGTTLASLPSLAHRRAAVTYYRQMLRGTRPHPSYARFNDVRLAPPVHPVLCVLGREDGAVLVDQSAGILRRLPRGSELVVIDGAGHFIQIDRPEALCDHVLRFVAS